MVVVNLPSSITYSNLYSLSGFSAGSSLIVTNNTSYTAFIVQAISPPLASSDQYPLQSGQTVLIHGNDNPIWIRGGSGPLIVQSILETITPFTAVDLPHDMYTSNAEGFRRIRVDTGQTGFFTGREFRTFFEFSIPAGQVQVLKFVSLVDFILFEQSLSVDAGGIRFQALTGATEVVTFNTPLPVIGKNRMAQRQSPYYTPVNTVTTHATPVALGSAVTGGTVVENFRVVAANATAQQTTVSGGAQSERGLPAGTFYLRLHNFGTGTATGVYSLFWEERP